MRITRVFDIIAHPSLYPHGGDSSKRATKTELQKRKGKKQLLHSNSTTPGLTDQTKPTGTQGTGQETGMLPLAGFLV